MSTRASEPSEEVLSNLRELEATLRGMSARQFEEFVCQETRDNLERLEPMASAFHGQGLVDVAVWSVSYVMYTGCDPGIPSELRRVLAIVLRRAAEVVLGGAEPARGGN